VSINVLKEVGTLLKNLSAEVGERDRKMAHIRGALERLRELCDGADVDSDERWQEVRTIVDGTLSVLQKTEPDRPKALLCTCAGGS
jgi:hypothetical protein